MLGTIGVFEDMEQTDQVKKRRIPKSCSACRYSKLRCDKNTPCTRCATAGIECVYIERPKDSSIERFEKIENALTRLEHRLESVATAQQQLPPVMSHLSNSTLQGKSHDGSYLPQHRLQESTTSLASFSIREQSNKDVIVTGAVVEQDAKRWFSAFFNGCDRFVPLFDASDTYASVRSRSAVLFDTIIIFGARAAHGVLSSAFQNLYPLLRQHTSNLVLRLSGATESSASIDDIRAVLVIATYSENGAILNDVAICAALRATLPAQVDVLLSSIAQRNCYESQHEQALITATRIWYYLFVLDTIVSLDGGKPSSLVLHSSPRRIRALLNHPKRTVLDVRLFAQVELNTFRSSAHNAIVTAVTRGDPEEYIMAVVRGTNLDLDLWLLEWQGIISRDSNITPEHGVVSLNLNIQHAWALLSLHLRALTACGIDNIALMTEDQRHLALAAKQAAERHLHLLLSSTTDESSVDASFPARPYTASLPYAMEFVWAKNAFCVLILLRLALLLENSSDQLMTLLSEAQEFLRELSSAEIGVNTSYTRILAKAVKKCENAVRVRQQPDWERDVTQPGDWELQSFIPKQFLFEWAFPGLQLCYIPLEWQDLFLDFENTTSLE